MKKIYSFMVAAVALFAAVSCNKELPQEENLPVAGETVVYTASADGADTKAALNEATKKSEWVAGDAITVHDGTNGWTFTTAEAGANVDFSNSEGFGEYRPVLAVYPAGTYTADVEAKTAMAYIPTYQSVMAGTYDDKAALAVAYSENDKFAFKNAHALIKFTVKSPNIKAIEFYGNNGEAITGNMLVSLNEKNTIGSVLGQDTVFEEGKDNEWTGKGTWVKCSSADENNNWCFTNGETYYAVIAPASFDEGVSLNIFLNDGSYEGKKIEKVKTTTSGLILKANTILNIGDVEYVAPATVEKVYLHPGVWGADNAWFSAHFFNSVGGAEDVKMTDEDADGVYEVSVPAGMESVIFCRMNPEYTEFGWDVWEGETEVENHVWNQTGDLVLPLAGDTKVYYNVTDWEAGEWSDTPQENTPDQPEVVAKEWGIVGTMTDWSDNIPMTLVDGWYVAENVTIKTSDEFKFRVGTTWDELKTYNATTIVDGTEYSTVDGQGNGNGMKVAVSAIYSVYLSIDAATMKVVKTGDIPLPEVKNWGIAGSMTNWTDGNDIVMSLVGDWYIAEDVEMPAGTTFKFRVDNDWTIQLTYAASEIVEGELYTVAKGDANITVKVSAIYDVYLSRDETTMKIVKVGEYVAPEPEPEPEDGKTIYLNAGGSSLWDQAGAYFDVWHWKAGGSGSWVTMKASSTAGVYECKIAQESDMVIFVRKDPSSTAQAWAGVWNQTGDLAIPAGKNMYTITGWGNTDGTWSTK